jgi:hypothetical protein
VTRGVAGTHRWRSPMRSHRLTCSLKDTAVHGPAPPAEHAGTPAPVRATSKADVLPEVAAVALAGVAAWFSVNGMVTLFPGASVGKESSGNQLACFYRARHGDHGPRTTAWSGASPWRCCYWGRRPGLRRRPSAIKAE